MSEYRSRIQKIVTHLSDLKWPNLATESSVCVLFAGEGQYGKVYTCISVDTGELMAMKEVSGLASPGAPLCEASLCDRGLRKKLVCEAPPKRAEPG